MSEHQFEFIRTMCCRIEEFFPTLSSDIALFIACQSALETCFGLSRLCRIKNNYFGMKNPMSRPSTSLVRGMSDFEWAEFDSCYSSIADYFMCVAYHKPCALELANLDSFKFFIKNWYCLERDYISKITKIFNQFKSFKNG